MPDFMTEWWFFGLMAIVAPLLLVGGLVLLTVIMNKSGKDEE